MACRRLAELREQDGDVALTSGTATANPATSTVTTQPAWSS